MSGWVQALRRFEPPAEVHRQPQTSIESCAREADSSPVRLAGLAGQVSDELVSTTSARVPEREARVEAVGGRSTWRARR
jgi:hypothetical protein